MLPPLIDIAPFRQALLDDQLILTPNHRLAAKIAESWAIEMQSQANVWRAPRVFSIDHWLRHCWDELQDQNHKLVSGLSLVGQQQSRYYWDRAIAESNSITRADAKGRFSLLAADTQKILDGWNLSLNQLPLVTPGTVQFAEWARNYANLLQRNQLISPARSWQLVAEGFAQSGLPRESSIYLYGFQSIPPAQLLAINSACDQHLEIVHPISHCKGSLVRCLDPRHELTAAAQWAAQQLAAKPDQRIGIIIPELNNSLAQVSRIVAEALTAESTEVAVNISAGTALLDTSPVRAACELLGILQDRRPLQDWLELLHSPYSIFAQLPVQVMVDAELALRDSRAFEFTLEKFANHLSHAINLGGNTDEIAESLKPLFELRNNQRQINKIRQTFSQWRQYFEQTLNDLGWPGKPSLDSMEYQQREHWQRLLDLFSGLDNLGIEVGLNTARRHLLQMAQDAVFHPQTGDAPLQILGLLEGSGLSFDQLWIMGMHSGNFPASVAINPLLPAEFQREHRMPHSLPERELAIAQQLWSDYKNHCGRLIVSYPSMRGEEQLAPSPLIQEFDLTPLDELINGISLHPKWLQQLEQTELVEEPACPFNQKLEKVEGGSKLLKNQSQLPFNAFAIHRLWAQPLQQPNTGLLPMDRGTLLHDVMYRLWTEWQRSSHLHSLSDKQISASLDNAIDASLTKMATDHQVLLGERYRLLEHRRLHKLLGQWIEEEKSRPAFNVLGLEQQASIEFDGLGISLRVDRIDQVGDQLLIIDYKTGEVAPGHWYGERPKDPQLPLYLLASDPTADGGAFAQIKGGKIKFVGTGSSALFDDLTVAEDWSWQLDQWQVALADLAAEFVAGSAPVQVFDSSTLSFQDYLLPLNRYLELADINARLELAEVPS
jgi:probable DNA repair protein